ncbi:Hypothetical predicted protein [Cloeon dipterum]|uniref:Uncharacterized protein n=1 Tax=Cloeon dipterum TaxID=197152 RepID=A0A8S1CK79_9INSE|nr:Hypothetical predicted protein [Cloeon dipterum]
MASSLRAAAVTVLALVLASLHECSPQSDRPTLSLNGGSYGLTGGPTLIPPAPTNRPGSLYDGGASYGLGGQGVRPGGGYGGGGGFNGPPGGAAPPVHELDEDGPYYRPHFRPPFGISGGYLPFPTKYGQGGTSGDVPFGGTGVGNFQGGGILPGGRPPQKVPNRPLIGGGGGAHLGNLPPGININNINNPKPLFGGGGGGFGGSPHLSQSDRPGFAPSGPSGGPPGLRPGPYGGGVGGNRPFGGSPHVGIPPPYEDPNLKDPALFTGGYDTCKCSLSFNCNSPGIKFGKCDAGKQYCCYNSRVAGSNKQRPSSFFGNTALHQYYARPEHQHSGGGEDLRRPVRGPGVLVGPGGPVDPTIHPRRSSELPATNKLFPGDN